MFSEALLIAYLFPFAYNDAVNARDAMKIVYISRSIIPSRTANSVHVMRMCQALAKLGHEVTLLAPWTKKLEEKGVEDLFAYYGVDPVFTVKKLYSPNIKYLKKRIYSLRCLRVVRDVNPDLVYGRDDMMALYLSASEGYGTGVEKHMPIGDDRLADYFFRKLMGNENGGKLVVISDALKQIYHTQHGVALNRIFVAHDGADMIPDGALPEHVDIERVRLQVGYVGSLFKGRGIDVIIELARRLSECDFHLIGGSEKDIAYWKAHAKLSNLHFHGFVEPKVAYRYRNMCDVLLAPYQTDEEGNHTSRYMSPLKLFEYMSSHKAIISSDLPVIREVLNEENAILVDPFDLDGWERAMRSLIDDPSYRERIAGKAYEDFTAHYTWGARVESIIGFLKGHHG
jgi:glycosyltransferase involved in cell wall biosynthesis